MDDGSIRETILRQVLAHRDMLNRHNYYVYGSIVDLLLLARY